MLGVFWKIQEICSKTGIRISKIDGEMSEIIEPKVGNPENSISRNWATLSHPWNLTFLENNIFKPSSYFLNYFNFNNVRFEVGKKICLSISGHHPETWQVKKSSLGITSLSISSKKLNYFLSAAILVHKNCSFGHHWIHAKSRTGE